MVDSTVSIRTIIISAYETNGQGWVQEPEHGTQNCDVISCFLIKGKESPFPMVVQNRNFAPNQNLRLLLIFLYLKPEYRAREPHPASA